MAIPAMFTREDWSPSGEEQNYTVTSTLCQANKTRNSVVRLTDRARNDLKCVEGP